MFEKPMYDLYDSNLSIPEKHVFSALRIAFVEEGKGNNSLRFTIKKNMLKNYPRHRPTLEFYEALEKKWKSLYVHMESCHAISVS